MVFLNDALQVLLAAATLAAVLIPIVGVHELGHFAAGRALGIPVETFSIGFGRELLARVDRCGTRWRLALIPLGGYVRFEGPAERPPERAGEGFLDRLLGAPPADAFSTAKPSKRLVVALAGPAASVAFSFLVYLGVWLWLGVPAGGLLIREVQAGGAAAAAGIVAGDVIASVDGRTSQRLMLDSIAMSSGKTLRVVVRRGAEETAKDVVARPQTADTSLGKVEIGRFGVMIDNRSTVRRFAPGEAVLMAGRDVAFLWDGTIGFFGQLVTGKASMKDVSSPVGVAVIASKLVRFNVELFFRFFAGISFAIGVTNLLPIPALDGGQSVVALYEIARRRAVAPATILRLHAVGLASVVCILALVVSREVGSLIEFAMR